MTTTLCNGGKYDNGAANGDNPEEQDLCNEVDDIMAGISKLEIDEHQSPSRYVTKEGECSVESCLNQFTALELMTGSNKVVCEACTAREKKVIYKRKTEKNVIFLFIFLIEKSFHYFINFN